MINNAQVSQLSLGLINWRMYYKLNIPSGCKTNLMSHQKVSYCPNWRYKRSSPDSVYGIHSINPDILSILGIILYFKLDDILLVCLFELNWFTNWWFWNLWYGDKEWYIEKILNIKGKHGHSWHLTQFQM